MTDTRKHTPTPGADGLILMAKFLAVAHSRYFELFGQSVHGSEKQFAALLELCPQAKSAIELWDKRRIEMETV